MKFFVVGLPFFSKIENKDLEQLERVCQVFGNQILLWYFNPPSPLFSYLYNSRRVGEISLDIFLQELEILKKYNQKIQLALNSFNILEIPEKQILQDILKFQEYFGKPDNIVLKKELYSLIKSIYPEIPLTYSYNNIIDINDFKSQEWDTIVLGRKYLRDFNFFHTLKKSFSGTFEILVNNGCHKYCPYNCSECQKGQMKRLEEIGVLSALAEQSLIPEELVFYPEDFIYKISSRPSTFDYIFSTLMLYNSGSSKSVDLSRKETWYYFSRLGPLYRQLPDKFSEDDLKSIIRIKQDLWEKEINNIVRFKNEFYNYQEM